MPQVRSSVVLLQHNADGEKLIASAAKLCYSNKSIEQIIESNNFSDNSEFIQKLMDLGHLSVIEHISFTFGIEGVSRALLAQITRHRIASFSVKSQRYAAAKENFNFVIPPSIEALGADSVEEYCKQMHTIGSWYEDWQKRLGGSGEKANEDARFVLPNAAETKLILTMNARELLHFFSLRCCNRAQWELRQVAWDMLKLCIDVCPQIFRFAGASCIRGKCSEGAFSCKKQDEVKKAFNKLLKGE